MKASTMMKLLCHKLATATAVAALCTTMMGCLAEDGGTEDDGTEIVDEISDSDSRANGGADELVDAARFDSEAALSEQVIDIDVDPASLDGDSSEDGGDDELNQLLYNPDPTPWLDTEANTGGSDDDSQQNPDPTPWLASSSDEEPDPQPWR
jgi:hypothetical protein